MAEPKTPWLYPYREDPQQTRLGQPVFRPFVPVSLATGHASTPELEGLVDGKKKMRSAVSFHTFRHTCASLLFEAGRNVKQVQAWLGMPTPASPSRPTFT